MLLYEDENKAHTGFKLVLFWWESYELTTTLLNPMKICEI